MVQYRSVRLLLFTDCFPSSLRLCRTWIKDISWFFIILSSGYDEELPVEPRADNNYLGLRRETTSERGCSALQLNSSSQIQSIRMWPKLFDDVGNGLAEPMQGVSQAVHPTSSCHLGSLLLPSQTGGCPHRSLIVFNLDSLRMLVLRWLQHKWKLWRLEKLSPKLLPAFDQKGWDAEMMRW